MAINTFAAQKIEVASYAALAFKNLCLSIRNRAGFTKGMPVPFYALHSLLRGRREFNTGVHWDGIPDCIFAITTCSAGSYRATIAGTEELIKASLTYAGDPRIAEFRSRLYVSSLLMVLDWRRGGKV
jgi:hypothetical protein